MRKWLIELLGGYPKDQMFDVNVVRDNGLHRTKLDVDDLRHFAFEDSLRIHNLEQQLREAQKNDKRDPKTGRFMK